MTTWLALGDALRTRYRLALDEPARLGLVWRFADHIQRQTLELATAHSGQPHVLVLCNVADETALSPLDALRHNATLATGSLALIAGTYHLRAALPLLGMTLAGAEHAIELLAREAAGLRTRLTAVATPAPYYE